MRLRGREWIKRWAYPVLLAGIALIFDAADRRVPFSVVGNGLLDEVAHLATAALGLLVLERFLDLPRRFYVAALVASVAIDLDHIPLYLGLLGNQTQRPVTHSLATVIVFVVAAARQPQASSRARRGSDRPGAPLRAGHRRGSARRKDALAASANGMDSQLLVVPGNDHRVHSRKADPCEYRHARGRTPLREGTFIAFNSS